MPTEQKNTLRKLDEYGFAGGGLFKPGNGEGKAPVTKRALDGLVAGGLAERFLFADGYYYQVTERGQSQVRLLRN